MEQANRFRIRRFLYPTVFKKAGPDVDWEPSPPEVVDDMIGLAQVRGTDLVYDLGCGDGRIVIAAAAKTGARGVGVDLNPRRVGESHENALLARVGGLTRFVKEDLFEADLSDATVLFLFLFPDVNLRLRPKLLRELKPGTRIVSYCHDMGRWRPDDITRRMSNDIYLWIVPGNMSGIWEGIIETGGRQLPLRMTMRQEFQQVSGAVFVGRKVFQVKNTGMEGETFFLSDRDDPQGHGLTVSVRGAVRDDMVTGTVRTHAFPQERSPFVARRDPSTRMPLAQ
ncbi:MAG: class I SAM-dependent methyltransferase [Syntrophorhabdales bacterium]|jgi:SAM-dependent methyltransferase